MDYMDLFLKALAVLITSYLFMIHVFVKDSENFKDEDDYYNSNIGDGEL